MTKKTGYLWNEVFLGHQTSNIHPENPQRSLALAPKNFKKQLPNLQLLETNFRLAHWLKKVHSPAHISFVEDAFVNNYRHRDTGETLVTKDSFDVATFALCGSLSVLQAISLGKILNGFAAVRPPGHHAGTHNSRGFCYFNNIAACAKFAQAYMKLKRILIVDWDVHPGDGTMQIFYEDPDVYFFSIHQNSILSDAVGTEEQIGKNEGEGTTLNVNVEAGTGGKEYISLFESKLEKFALKCRPDIILISAGFDAHSADPLGGLCLQNKDFAILTKIVMDLADTFCTGKIASVLEGGYNIGALNNSVYEHLRVLSRESLYF